MHNKVSGDVFPEPCGAMGQTEGLTGCHEWQLRTGTRSRIAKREGRRRATGKYLQRARLSASQLVLQPTSAVHARMVQTMRGKSASATV